MTTVASDITSMRAARFKEQESKRHSFEIKKLKAENATEFQKEVKLNESVISNMRRDYERKIAQLDTELERKLNEIRNDHKDKLKVENERLTAEVADLKSAHNDQVAEIRVSHQNEIEGLNESHRNTLENAKTKFLQEKQKWEI